MNRDRAVQLVAAAVLATALAISGALGVSLAAESGRAQLVYTDVATEGEPPTVALGVAMGAFRGLFVNYLWLRANRLKEDGKFYEAMELSSTITKLQPRFPRVWAFHAWNMAYNISVATNTAEERWQWVDAGIRLLRDEGIPMNPNDTLLHKELAWIFVHKVQGFMDDANRYYKRQIAKEWQIVLGEPPRLEVDTDNATQRMADWFRPVVAAPATLQRVIELERAELASAAAEAGADPQAISPKVPELVERIREEAGLDLDVELLRFVAYRRAFETAWYAEEGLIALGESSINAELDKLLQDDNYADAWERVLAHVRKRTLIDEYHMEPARMLRYMLKYGPLDWRHPAAHAVYWAAKGVEESIDRSASTRFTTVNTDRIVFHGVQELWRSGTIFYDLVTDEFVALNNFHFTDAYSGIFDELVERGGEVESEERVYTLYRAGYENFLREVVRAYYRLGLYDTANNYLNQLRSAQWLNLNNPNAMEEFQMPLDQFVAAQLEERLTIPYVATSEVTGALTDAYVRGLLGGNQRIFRAQWEYAQDVHRYYFEQQVITETIDDRADRLEELPRDFRDVAGQVLLSLLATGNVQRVQASRIYTRMPAEIRQIIYDDLATMMIRRGVPRAAIPNLFPEPPGMEQYRELRRRLQEQSEAQRQRDIEQRQQ